MPRNILYYMPADAEDRTATAYGHVFIAGEALDLGEDTAAFDRLKTNPEFSTDGSPKTAAKPAVEALPVPDLTDDESNDGKDAKARGATQAKALKAARAEASKAKA